MKNNYKNFVPWKKGMSINMNKIKKIVSLSYLKDLFKNLDNIDLKIMKLGLKICFAILIFSTAILYFYLKAPHNIFLYNLGLTIFRICTYVAVEFIICGIIVDKIKKSEI